MCLDDVLGQLGLFERIFIFLHLRSFFCLVKKYSRLAHFPSQRGRVFHQLPGFLYRIIRLFVKGLFLVQEIPAYRCLVPCFKILGVLEKVYHQIESILRFTQGDLARFQCADPILELYHFISDILEKNLGFLQICQAFPSQLGGIQIMSALDIIGYLGKIGVNG